MRCGVVRCGEMAVSRSRRSSSSAASLRRRRRRRARRRRWRSIAAADEQEDCHMLDLPGREVTFLCCSIAFLVRAVQCQGLEPALL
jgi:hypothetical protein